MNTKTVQDFIMESETNLRIAEAAAAALPDVRHKMAWHFLKRLDARIMGALPGWKSTFNAKFFSEPYATYAYSKSGWDGQYCLALQFRECGREMHFGVLRVGDKSGKYTLIRGRLFSPELLNAVRREHAFAEQVEEWWEVIVRMERPAPNWNYPEVIWRMYQDDVFLGDVAEQLIALANNTAPIIDKLVAEYSGEPATTR